MRIGVTLLDSYRYWREAEYFTEEAEQEAYEEIVARLLGTPPPQNEAMLRSIAFHRICENPLDYIAEDHLTYTCDGFDFDAISTNELLLDLLPDRVCEVKMEQDVNGVTLVGKADYLYGITAGDQKLSKKVEPDKYGESIQWMAYLMMMDGRSFKYHVAQPVVRKGGIIHLNDYKAFPFYRSRTTDERVLRLVDEFAEFARPILEKAA